MDIKGGIAYLSKEEQKFSGYPREILVARIDCVDLLARLHEEEAELDARRAAGDDEITHSERAAIVPDTHRLLQKRTIIENMAGQVLVHEASLFAGS